MVQTSITFCPYIYNVSNEYILCLTGKKNEDSQVFLTGGGWGKPPLPPAKDFIILPPGKIPPLESPHQILIPFTK